MDVAGLAAILATVLIVVIAAFQASLAAGAPLGAAAWGGQHPGVLPRGLRVASGLVALFVYPAIALVILRAAGVVDTGAVGAGWGTTGIWVLAAFFLVGAVMNGLSRSRPERVWAPVSFVIAVCCVVVALAT